MAIFERCPELWERARSGLATFISNNKLSDRWNLGLPLSLPIDAIHDQLLDPCDVLAGIFDQTLTLTVKPMNINLSVRPGYTVDDDKILVVHKSPHYQYVVQDSNGDLKLVGSGAVIGFTDEKAKDDFRGRGPKFIKGFKGQLDIGIRYVALRELDNEKGSLPLMVVGFYYGLMKEPSSRKDVHISRSSLKDILGGLGDSLIARSLSNNGTKKLVAAVERLAKVHLGRQGHLNTTLTIGRQREYFETRFLNDIDQTKLRIAN